MLKKFQAKLRSMCRIARGDDPHWVPCGAKVVRVPGSGDVVSLRRAVYAAFVGPLFGAEDVSATCELVQCVNPDHLATEPCRGATSKPLDLSGLLEEGLRRNAPVAGADVLSGHEQTAKIKGLLNRGLGVVEVAAKLGISTMKVVAVHNRAGA